MYAKELFISGTEDDFRTAYPYFHSLEERELKEAEQKAVQCVLVRCGVIEQDAHRILGSALKNLADGIGSSEVCTCLGEYYEQLGEFSDATLWYYNAAYETEAELSLAYHERLPLEGLIRCYKKMGVPDQADFYQSQLNSLTASAKESDA